MKQVNSQDIEITLLLEALRLKYGYDFRGYARSSIKRRIMRRIALSGAKSISDLQHKVLHDEELSDTLLMDFSINVSEMFRDPSFYKTIREHVVPELMDIPFIKIWHAGCATGEEVYSLAILLREEGLYEKCTIYATDFNTRVLAR
ncbi:MAG: CheR family methyltransferase, partial [Pseudomonadota bacterium]